MTPPNKAALAQAIEEAVARADMPLRDPRMRRSALATHVGKLITSDRNRTHGDPHEQFKIQQALYRVLTESPGTRHRELPDVAKHSAMNITTKLSRIVTGRNLQDHWLDIAGFALIAAEVAEDPLEE